MKLHNCQPHFIPPLLDWLVHLHFVTKDNLFILFLFINHVICQSIWYKKLNQQGQFFKDLFYLQKTVRCIVSLTFHFSHKSDAKIINIWHTYTYCICVVLKCWTVTDNQAEKLFLMNVYVWRILRQCLREPVPPTLDLCLCCVCQPWVCFVQKKVLPFGLTRQWMVVHLILRGKTIHMLLHKHKTGKRYR